MMMIKKIVTGGQTGVDRAALDVALEMDLPCGGWCPKGRRSEDGMIDLRYPLNETPSADYVVRTEWNVRDSDGTLILFYNKLTGGTAYTLDCVEKYLKPHCLIDLEKNYSKEQFQAWINENIIEILNVAGPRERAQNPIYETARKALSDLFKE